MISLVELFTKFITKFLLKLNSLTPTKFIGQEVRRTPITSLIIYQKEVKPKTMILEKALAAANDNMFREISKSLSYGIWYELYKERNKLEFILDERYSTNINYSK